jgi:hypothetical protein
MREQPAICLRSTCCVIQAAARNLSSQGGGGHVTQSAVSRQVKAEEHLGVALFLRQHRALLLTEAARAVPRDSAGAAAARRYRRKDQGPRPGAR